MAVRPLHVVSVVFAVALAIAAKWAWSAFGSEPVPAELPPVTEPPSALVIPGLGEQPDLDFAALDHPTSFFVMVGPMSDEASDEGQALNRALNRWQFPATTRGFIVVDLPGFSWLGDHAARFADRFAAEARFPIYLDFEGAFRAHFNLAKGHYGFVVVDGSGAIHHRNSGAVNERELAAIAERLGAREPAPGTSAPPFTAGPLDNHACRGHSCVLLFFGRSLAADDVPELEASFGASFAEHWVRLQEPAMRLLMLAKRVPLSEHTNARGVIIGTVPDDDALGGWARVERADDARTAFGLQPESSAIVVLDEDGRVAVRHEGFVPLYLWGRIADVTELEVDFEFGE